MLRVKKGNIIKKNKKILSLAKGYKKPNSTLSTFACEQILQSYFFAYISRRLNKRYVRTQWISRINLVCNFYGYTYSKYIKIMHKNKIWINRYIFFRLTFKDTLIIKTLIEIFDF